jgi:uncharacterized protein with GYD domain
MFGKYSVEGIRGIRSARTAKAAALVKKHGGELKAVYALLGETDLLIIADLPDTARAMQTGIGLAKLLGASFTTAPALSVQEFDKLAG